MSDDSNPVVSIIVPARNEEASLGACLQSLVAQTGIEYEIVVVNDDSTDRTAEIAQLFTRDRVAADVHVRPAVRLITAPPLPDKWTGKNNAMAAGANIAKGKWLLFTDADTVHRPGALARAVAEAEEHSASLLSYSPEQEVCTFWEKALMPVIFAELATTYPPQAVNDPVSPIAAANGQYLMILREAYDAVGGHAKIKTDLLEDVAMAHLIKSSGRQIFFRYGGDAVRTRMYRGFTQMKEGWTKNLALLFPHPATLALLRSGEFVLIFANVIIALWAGASGRSNLALQTTLLTIILAGWFGLRIRKAHFSLTSDLAAILGLPLFVAFLLLSLRAHRTNAVGWKGRRYGNNTSAKSFSLDRSDTPQAR